MDLYAERKLAEERLKNNRGNNIYLISGDKKERIKNIPNGNIEFKGKNSVIEFYEDFKIKELNLVVGENSYIKFGKHFRVRFNVNINANAKNTKIIFGDNVRLSRGSIFAGDEDNLEIIIGDNFLTALQFTIRNSDGHTIYDLEDKSKPINIPKFGIHIGDNVWLGYDVIIMKDVIIPNNCIVGTGSVVVKRKGDFVENSIIAGNPAETIKTNIGWDERTIKEYLKDLNDK